MPTSDDTSIEVGDTPDAGGSDTESDSSRESVSSLESAAGPKPRRRGRAAARGADLDPAASQLFQAMDQASAIHHSTALNILAVYLKGQKLLYIEAKTHCEHYLNSLMLPAIINSAVCTVLSIALAGVTGGPVILAALTAFNSCVLALISYLKLDAKAEAHKASAYQFDKLQSLCEFNAGKFLFFGRGTTYIKIMTELETKVKEIKDSNQFVLPEAVRHRFPKIFSTNVFSIVKRLQNQESILVNEYVDIYRRYDKKGDSATLLELQAKTEEIIWFKNSYLQIDLVFKSEIREDQARTEASWGCCKWLKT